VPVCTDRDKDKGRDRDRDRASQAANGFHNNYMADEMGFGGVRMGFGEWTEEEIKDFAPFHSFPLPPYTNAFPQQQQQQYSHVMSKCFIIIIIINVTIIIIVLNRQLLYC